VGEDGYAGEGETVVVGSGPNGLAAAIVMACAGRRVTVVESGDTLGGGMRSAPLTLPGFVHDICSAIHPLGAGSTFFRSLSLEQEGLEWIHPAAPLAHPMDGDPAILLEKDLKATSINLEVDGESYVKLLEPFIRSWEDLSQEILAPVHLPSHPLLLARFSCFALRSARGLAESTFCGERARALFAGLAAHSFLPLERPVSAAFGLILGMTAHAAGWPVARGGSQQIADALAARLQSRGGRIILGKKIESLDQLSGAKTILFDISPREVLKLAGDRMSAMRREAFRRYRYGPGAFKVDWALAGPIPWRDQACLRAGTLHLGGTLAEIAEGEREVWEGKHPEKPFVILAQQSLFDPTRAPAGHQTGWAYCHVPNGSDVDMTERIENQVERFAPGFRDLILKRFTRTAAEFEGYNANYVGGDINGGVQDASQLFARPALRLNPYFISKGMYLCSSSTPPGGGVHGMCGVHAAHAALKE